MLIILDLGANDGCSIKKFQKICSDKNIGAENYVIHSFEPIPFFNKYLDKLRGDNVIIHNKLISTDNLDKKLFLSKDDNAGSTVLLTKTSNGIHEDRYITCESVDIADFINELPRHDELWVKMDVEGYEYELISHLHEKGLMGKIDKLFIEWHYKKLSDVGLEKHNEVRRMTKGIAVEEWSALRFSNNRTKKIRAYKKWCKRILTE